MDTWHQRGECQPSSPSVSLTWLWAPWRKIISSAGDEKPDATSFPHWGFLLQRQDSVGLHRNQVSVGIKAYAFWLEKSPASVPQQAGRSTLNQAGGEEAQVSFSYKQPPQGRIKGKRSMERSKKGKEGKRRDRRGRRRRGERRAGRRKQQGEKEGEVCAGGHHEGWHWASSVHAELKDFLGTEAWVPWPEQGQVDQLGMTTTSSVQSLSQVQLCNPCRPPCPSPTLGACSNSCPSSQWCHPTASSSVIPFFSCLQSFPAITLMLGWDGWMASLTWWTKIDHYHVAAILPSATLLLRGQCSRAGDERPCWHTGVDL